jgi:hypothetical protein
MQHRLHRKINDTSWQLEELKTGPANGLTAIGGWEVNAQMVINQVMKGCFMVKKRSEGLIAGHLPNEFEIRKLTTKLGNSFVRLTAAQRRKVMRALKQLTFGKVSSVSERDLWSKDEALTCYLLLKPISPKMANGFHRWTSEHLKTGRNNKLVLDCLMGTLDVRAWIEDPESDFGG